MRADTGAALADGGAEVTDFKDVAAADSLGEVRDVVLDHAALELAQVRAALHRLADGTFGFCTECGNGIDERRLLALPAAALCTQCQAETELAVATR